VKRLDTLKIEQVIAQAIVQSKAQRITFAEFMELALYHPQFGYYSTRDRIIGAQGDFVTSAHMGRDFGELMAVQFVDMWEVLGAPADFTVVEMGAGQGLIAMDAIAYLQTHYPDCFKCLNYIVVEKSPALRAKQQKRLKPWQDKGVNIVWRSLDEIPDNSIVGCVFSNELVDAFAVHWVELSDNRLQEIWVTADNDTLAPTVGPLSTPKIESYFAQVGIDFSAGYSDGYRTEVNLAALDWIAEVNQKLRRGYLLTIDYGYTAERYYSPARREGTLQCYYRHSYHNDPFIHLGEQDITAHVDFTALEKKGEALGLQTLGFTQQGLFLMALGLGDRLSQLSEPNANKPATAQEIQSLMRRREGLQQLISPMGLGNFGVLIQGKSLTQKEIDRPLKGLSIPSMF